MGKLVQCWARKCPHENRHRRVDGAPTEFCPVGSPMPYAYQVEWDEEELQTYTFMSELNAYRRWEKTGRLMMAPKTPAEVAAHAAMNDAHLNLFVAMDVEDRKVRTVLKFNKTPSSNILVPLALNERWKGSIYLMNTVRRRRVYLFPVPLPDPTLVQFDYVVAQSGHDTYVEYPEIGGMVQDKAIFIDKGLKELVASTLMKRTFYDA